MTGQPTAVADYQLVRRMDDSGVGQLYEAIPPTRLGVEGRVLVRLFECANEAAFDVLVAALQTFASVDSPYLLKLHDAGQDGTWFFYSSEFPELGTLDQVDPSVSAKGRVGAAIAACAAAEDLHRAGILHRDVRPGVVHVTADGGRLGGLDLSRHLQQEGTVTMVGGQRGVAYVDPAIILGSRPSTASDVYSLGAVAHLAAAGVSIYPGLPDADPLLAARTILKRPPVIDATVPAPLAAVIERATAREQGDRYESAALLASALREAADRSWNTP